MSCNIAVSPAAMMALWAGFIETYCKPVSCPGKPDMGGRYSHQTNYILWNTFPHWKQTYQTSKIYSD